jgi:uncharacterized pyridoxamine 5'-phosphate oxidase family protein
MKNTNHNLILAFIAMLSFAACQQNPAKNKLQPEPTKADALSGASIEKATVIKVSKEEGLSMVYNFLASSNAYYFATIENNAPKVRPIGIATNYDGKLWFHVGKNKPCYQQIQTNPNVEIAAMDAKGRVIRIRGKAVCAEDLKLDSLLFGKYPFLQNIYNDKTGNKIGNFYITNGVADVPTDSNTVVVAF